jgi:pyruvate formate lyase activating enzyme
VNGGIRCDLCPNAETLRPGEFGRCRTRQNLNGRLVTWGHDSPCVLNVDPIEKNPSAHVVPGALVLSVAHAGCNLRCLYCQNWQYSQRKPTETKNIKDFSRVQTLTRVQARRLRGLVFTYTEPGVCPEFTGEMAAMAKTRNMLTALCTCGYLLERPFRELLKPFDAVTITYKGPDDAFYSGVCGAGLSAVQDSMLAAKSEGKWLEVATLVLPNHNDDASSLKRMASWLARNLGADTPWHLERFSPMYKLTDLPPTPQATLERAREIGRDAGLKFVYVSNLAPHEGNHTYCPRCKRAVITRLGFKVLRNDLKDGVCPHCRQALPGIWT